MSDEVMQRKSTRAWHRATLTFQIFILCCYP